MLSRFAEERECTTFHLDWKADHERVARGNTNALEPNRLPGVEAKGSVQVDPTMDSREEDLENWFVPEDT